MIALNARGPCAVVHKEIQLASAHMVQACMYEAYRQQIFF